MVRVAMAVVSMDATYQPGGTRNGQAAHGFRRIPGFFLAYLIVAV